MNNTSTNGKTVIVAGTNFGGYTAALKLRDFLHPEDRVVVISPNHTFLFTPSLIWVPFGLRSEADITFDVRPIYEKRGIEFIEKRILRFEADKNQVVTEDGALSYDFLVIATGPKPDYETIPGMTPGEFNNSIVTIKDALRTGEAWHKFLKNPGPVVVGAIQGAACFGAAYEFMFNIRHQLAKRGIKVPMTFVTAEPFLTHFGIGGFANGQSLCEWMFNHYDIQWQTEAKLAKIEKDRVVLANGDEIESAFTSIVPRFVGVDAVRTSPGLSLPNGFIETTASYRHKNYSNIYAAGVAVQVEPPSHTNLSCGVPRTGYPTEQMAEIAAWNIAGAIYKDREEKFKPFGEMTALCVMDSGNMGMMILGDHMLSPRKHEVIIPGPQAHWAKLAFEKYYLTSRKRGYV